MSSSAALASDPHASERRLWPDAGARFTTVDFDIGAGNDGALTTDALGPVRDALSPLVTAFVADDPVRSSSGTTGDDRSTGFETRSTEVDAARRHALQRAVAEIAETHAAAADLATQHTVIDLALDLPGSAAPVAPSTTSAAAGSTLIVPDMIRACRDRVARHALPGDRLKIDIVASIFDRVLADDRVPTAVRNTLARLQLPVLRIALVDESFFASRTHPTRRLLDRLAAAATEWDMATDEGRAMRVELDRVVHAVVHGASDDADVHARLLESFETGVLAIADASKTSSSKSYADPADRDVMLIKATIQISQLLEDVEVDRTIRFFLLDVWSRVLVEIGCREADSARDAMLARAKRLCVDLAWSAAPKATTGERARLAGLLPAMTSALRDGLRLIEYPKADEARFFAQWTRALHLATRRSHLGGAGSGRTEVGARVRDELVPDELDIDGFAEDLRFNSFGSEPSTLRADTLPRASMRSVAAVDTRPLERRLPAAREDEPSSLIEGTPSLLKTDNSGERRGTGKPKPPSTIRPAIDQMKKGAWFELREPRGFARVRLSWISPLKSFYLFVGADSALTRSFDPDALAELIEKGDLRMI